MSLSTVSLSKISNVSVIGFPSKLVTRIELVDCDSNDWAEVISQLVKFPHLQQLVMNGCGL
jgi:hypothetical protein